MILLCSEVPSIENKASENNIYKPDLTVQWKNGTKIKLTNLDEVKDESAL